MKSLLVILAGLFLFGCSYFQKSYGLVVYQGQQIVAVRNAESGRGAATEYKTQEDCQKQLDQDKEKYAMFLAMNNLKMACVDYKDATKALEELKK